MKKLITLVSALTIITALPAFAEDHTKTEITPDYIAGFLAGADLTDGAIIDNINSDNESDFIQRAYRTRLGKEHPSEQPTYLAGFCIPEGISEDTLISNISAQLKTTTMPVNTQRDTIVYSAIKTLYPCKK
ncbi:hypothetical protein [uncultured Amphritea sp.]|uniref:hypothetical protein n=1 Tax=uncultured Amphritea sp. TaxID=981605 RepID=UPI00262FAB03|nr:hypothetical protein [uncultured Amphritea sp.]